MEIALLKSSICLLAFIAFYKVFLERTSNHSFKRFYLLGVVLVSITIPFITFIEYIEPQNALTNISEVTGFSESQNPILKEPTNYLPIVLWSIYGLGVLLFLIRFVYNLSQIALKIRRNPKHKTNDFIRVLLKDLIIPHTFFSYIFFNKTKFENDEIPKEVLLHEQTHAKQKHSLDILFIEVLQIIFWFHPLIYILKKDIKLNHEFLADQAVINQGIESTNYQKILLSFSSNQQALTLEHAINYSSIKKRFTVMKTQTSKQTFWLRSLLLLPLLAILIFSFSSKKQVEKPTTEVVDNQEKTQETLLTINGIICDGSIPNLSKKGIENLILGTTTDQEIKSFLFKIAGKSTVKVTGNTLNKEAKNLLNNLEIGTIVQLFHIKTETDKFPPILITLVDKNDKNYSHSPIVKKGEVSNIPPPPPPTKVPQHEKGKRLTLNEIINKTPKNVESGYEMLDNGESHYFTVNDGKKTYYNKDGYITDDKGNILPPPPPAPKVLKGEVSNIPPPPPPKSPLDHVVEMAKKDANFYFEGKKITSDKAIEIIKSDNDLSISTQTKGFKKPMVNITTNPVITDENGKVITKVETVQDLKSNTQKDKNGYVEINGTTYFYTIKNKKITYFNRYGKKVNEKGTVLN
ncbi:MAG: M56 family metallopeptidase [Oceanihabitans sp.]|nr:M56 family metallopeptidase [Oceanihabitans sp.]